MFRQPARPVQTRPPPPPPTTTTTQAPVIRIQTQPPQQPQPHLRQRLTHIIPLPNMEMNRRSKFVAMNWFICVLFCDYFAFWIWKVETIITALNEQNPCYKVYVNVFYFQPQPRLNPSASHLPLWSPLPRLE